MGRPDKLTHDLYINVFKKMHQKLKKKYGVGALIVITQNKNDLGPFESSAHAITQMNVQGIKQGTYIIQTIHESPGDPFYCLFTASNDSLQAC